MILNMSPEYKSYYKSEIGLLEIVGVEEGIKSVSFVDDEAAGNFEIQPCLKECVVQLDQYFKGQRQEFSLKLAPSGSDFQKKVWQQLTKIPYGKTVSYLDIAKSIGQKKAVRAVGNANGRNKIVIIIPCHRVIGSRGQLTGYGGGLWRKEWLLKHENALG